MGLVPDSMLGQADERVEKAMETGARGQTTTHTDYGVIGDAFFKKAQLDLQIADLHANMGMRKAETMSNLEIQKAKLNLDATSLQIDAGFKAAEMKAMAEDRKVSFAEQLMGTIGGAASGAMAGYAATQSPDTVGANGQVIKGNSGKTGAILGAMTGGGMTMMGYQGGGRRGGEAAQKTLGHISDLSVSYKGMRAEQQQQDAMSGVMKSGKAIMDQLNTAKTPQERLAAMQKMEGFYGEAFQVAMTMPGANPEKAGNMVASMRKGFESASGMGGDPEQNRRNMRQLETLVKYQGDERRNDPKQQRAWANDYMRETASAYEEETGKAMPINMQRKAAYDLSPEIGEALDKKLGGEGNTTSSGSYGSMPGKNQQVSPSGRKVLPAPEQEQSTLQQVSPGARSTTGVTPIPNNGNNYQGPRGVNMDDDGEFVPKAEMDLAEKGGEAVEALGGDSEPSFKEKALRMGDKILGYGTEDGKPKLFKGLGRKADEMEAERTGKAVGEEGEGAPQPVKKKEFLQEDKKLNGRLEKQPNTEASARGRGAVKVVDRMVATIDKGHYPSDSQLKGFGEKVRTQGMDVGAGAGAVGGAIVTKSAGGAAAGAYVGSQLDINVGKGSGPFLDEDEEFSVDEMQAYKEAATMKFAKIQDPEGRISDADARRFESLWPKPGQSKAQQLAGLQNIKSMMLDEIETANMGVKGKLNEKREEEEMKTVEQQKRARNREAAKPPKQTKTGSRGSFIPLF